MQKQIRRRRAVLALLVVISIALLTEYFGERPGSPLHSIQRGVATVLTPVQDGASKVLSPFRDVVGYFSTMFNDRSKLDNLQKRYNTLLNQYADLQYQDMQYRQVKALAALDNGYGLSSYRPVTAAVIGQDPVLWYKTIEVNRGSNSGVKLHDPVVGPGGLVGEIKEVGSNHSYVSLVTSPQFAVGATIENGSGAPGLIQPEAGNPTTLTLVDLPTNTSNLAPRQLVVTDGWQDPHNQAIESIAPAGIPIGTVSSLDPQSSVLESQQVQVTPLANLQDLSVVQILVRPHP